MSPIHLHLLIVIISDIGGIQALRLTLSLASESLSSVVDMSFKKVFHLFSFVRVIIHMLALYNNTAIRLLLMISSFFMVVYMVAFYNYFNVTNAPLIK